MHAEPNDLAPETNHVAAMPEGEEKPPRGTKAMASLRWLLLALALFAAVYTNLRHFEGDSSHAAASGPKLYCPMHPEITSDRPGTCPICHMALEPIPEGRLGSHDTSHHGHEHGEHETLPNGTVPVVLSFDRVQAIGVRTSLVAKQASDANLRVTATVSAPEQGQAFVHTRSSGYVERASVEQTGVRVRKGQELLSIYSPEIYHAQAELLAARSWKGQDGSSPELDAARTKLELLGVSARAIDRILETGQPSRTVAITSPVSGWVVKKSAALGSYVTPEMTLFEIVDLSRVYVTAEVFLRDAHRIALGTEARFLPTGRENKATIGKIDLVYPTLSPDERTTRIRMQVTNPNGELRPGDYGTLELAAVARDTLVIPRDAVVDTGSSTYVFIDEGEGRFTPRIVTLGTDHGDAIEVKEGVREGDKVVTSATFLIDSESRLQASLASHGNSNSAHAH